MEIYVKLLSVLVFSAFGVAEGNSEKGENEWDVQRGKAASLWQQISWHVGEREPELADIVGIKGQWSDLVRVIVPLLPDCGWIKKIRHQTLGFTVVIWPDDTIGSDMNPSYLGTTVIYGVHRCFSESEFFLFITLITSGDRSSAFRLVKVSWSFQLSTSSWFVSIFPLLSPFCYVLLQKIRSSKLKVCFVLAIHTAHTDRFSQEKWDDNRKIIAGCEINDSRTSLITENIVIIRLKMINSFLNVLIVDLACFTGCYFECSEAC